MPGALSPYTVLEMGDHPSVAVLGMLLADQGANVTKIEPLTSDPLRGTPVFSVWNRGKQSITGRPRYRRQPSQVPAVRRGRRHRELLLPARTPLTSTGTASPSSTSPCPASAPAIPITTCAAAKSSFHPRPVSTSTAVLTTPKAPVSSPCPTRACSPQWWAHRRSPPRCTTGKRLAKSRTSQCLSMTPCSPRWERPSSEGRTSPPDLRLCPQLSAGSTVVRTDAGST